MAQEAEDEERMEDFNKYQESVIRAINYLLNFHDMRLQSDKKIITSKRFLLGKTLRVKSLPQ